MKIVSEMLNQKELTRNNIITLLSITDKKEQNKLLQAAYSIKEQYVGKKVFLRGLIELSNICRKNCLYCGIRADNKKINRYILSDTDIIKTIIYAQKHTISSIVIQSGEQNSIEFTERICNIISEIKKITNPEFRITLSLGEQSFETYTKWFNAGAQRYLLRIETSNKELYTKIHPNTNIHNFQTRVECLTNIKKIGYQTGTGVMIGLPFQTIENLADDLLFIKQMDIDMVGMGPYLVHSDTPLFPHSQSILPLMERFNLSLRMIAVLRILMPFINIASTTALQSIVPLGREQGLKAGANVIMPNISPDIYRKNYVLYDNKPCLFNGTEDYFDCLAKNISSIGEEINFNNYGDSQHFIKKVHAL